VLVDRDGLWVGLGDAAPRWRRLARRPNELQPPGLAGTTSTITRHDFGEDFELDAFRAAHASEEPVELNRVKAVERGVDQLYDYIAELAAFGLELAERRECRDETNARRDIDSLRDAGAISRADWSPAATT
jgi:hypothetical protein